jgi:hypothetical protein
VIHYHGTPLTPESAAASVFAGRHAMVSFANPEQMPLVMEVCQSASADNGAYPKWRAGEAVKDWNPFYRWLNQWRLHPSFDWFLIPDVIDGDEEQNDALISECPYKYAGVPVWHLHENLERLERLSYDWPRIALGSSGQYAQLKTVAWWRRMEEAMAVICDESGRPRTKLHGLRMLDVDVFTRFPFASADSTNVARNVGLDTRWPGTYPPAGKAARGIVLAGRIEAHQSAPIWTPSVKQEEFCLQEVSA